MTGRLDIDARLSPESRVVLPAPVRAALGVGPGDRVRFVVEDGEVRVLAAQALLDAIWANNHGGDAGDSVMDIRVDRSADWARAQGKAARMTEASAAEQRSEETIEESLLAQLGLGQSSALR